ncbi:hypothetical protein LCGC14_0617850 [marine sediment metagenome]|uniref:Uncharacterized protein n=1 Tax=marine sediment metagenome TaxID=412755 RepID=A0A0F9UEC0_9ZZZZ
MDVTTLRNLLLEIGSKQYHQIIDERRLVGKDDSIKTLFQRIQEVIGVWLATDYDKSGTDYSISGGNDGETIYLGASLPAGTEIVTSYIVADGLTDLGAQRMIDWARWEVLGEIQDFTLDIDNPVTNIERVCRVYWEMLTMANAYLLMNNVNFVQSDANMSLAFSYQTMSKLWGEGMSTDALFMRLYQRLDQIRKVLYDLSHESDGYVYEDSLGLWNNDAVMDSWLSDLHRTRSQSIPSGGIWVIE